MLDIDHPPIRRTPLYSREYKGACSGGDEEGDRESIVYNSYYQVLTLEITMKKVDQWVPLYLLGLAILFYLPRMFWLMVEGGLMKFFGQGTTTRCYIVEMLNMEMWRTSEKYYAIFFLISLDRHPNHFDTMI